MADDIVVGSVAVDIVPDTRNFRRDMNAKLHGLEADVTVKADTTGVRAQIENASKSRPATIRVKVDDAAAKTQLASLQNSLKDKSLALDLSTAEAKAKVASLQAQVAEVKGNADLDTDEAKRRIAALQAEIKTLRSSIEADTAPARAEIGRLRADIAAQRITIKAQADTAEAEAQLDTAARDRTATVNTRVTGEKTLFQAAGGLGALTTAAIALGPALIPVTAAVVGIGAALAAPLAIAAGGATVFGFITGFAIKQTEEQKKKIDELAKAVASAKEALASTQASAATSASNSLATANASAAASLKAAHLALANAKTAAQRHAAQARIDAAEAALSARRASIQRSQSASVAAAQRKVTAAVADYKAALAGLTPAQKKFLDAQDKLKGAFQGLIETSGPMILGPVTQALKILTGILPDISPLISAVSGAITKLMTGLGNSVKSPGFKAFIATFSRQVGPDIVKFGRIAGAAIKGLTGLMFGLADAFGPSVLNGLQSLTDKFADFGRQAQNGDKLRGFVDYFHKVGPQVAATIGAVARGIGHVVAALAPLGPPALKVIEGIANAISGIPIPVLTAMAAAFGAVVLASKANNAVGKLGGLLGGGGFGGRGASPARPLWVQSVNGGGIGGKGGSTGGVPIAKIGLLAALVTAGDIGNEVPDISGRGLTLGPKDFLKSARAGKITRSQLDDPALAQLFGLTQGQARKLFDGLHLKSTTDQVDNLKASLDKASQTIDQVGPKADRSFGQASRDVRDFSARLDAIHDKKVKVLLDDLEAVQKLRALQALRLKDKTLTIKVEQELDRVVGPGGGMGHPLGGGDSGHGASGDLQAQPRSGNNNTRSAPLVNVEHMEAHDYNDFLRQSQNRVISRGGGGVLLQGAV